VGRSHNEWVDAQRRKKRPLAVSFCFSNRMLDTTVALMTAK